MAPSKQQMKRIFGICLAVMLVGYAWGFFYHSQIGFLSFITIGNIAAFFLGAFPLGLIINKARQQRGLMAVSSWLNALGDAMIYFSYFLTINALFNHTSASPIGIWLTLIGIVCFYGSTRLSSRALEQAPINHRLNPSDEPKSQ